MNKRVYGLFFIGYVAALVAATADKNIPTALYLHMIGSLLAAEVFLSLVFWLGKRMGRYDVVDAAWGPTFIVISLTNYVWATGLRWEWNISLLYVVLTVLWGGRLSLHIAQRIRRTSNEDKRYVELRSRWHGNIARNIYLRIFMIQGLLATFISLPIIYVAVADMDALSLWIPVGSSIWLFGYAIEAIADAQLADFKSEKANHGKLMTRGLWRYSRNPNYFGELTMWWGIAAIALAAYPGWVGLGGAALIMYLIMHVSGVPLKEKGLSKRPGWAAYAARTRRLLPLPK